MTRCVAGRPRAAADRGFTLIEVILAIVIAVGILVVALYFYQQSSNLRTQLLRESDRIAAARMVMDRLTLELRAAFPDPLVSFTGGPTSMRFVRAGVPGLTARILRGDLGAAGGDTDLVVVGYAVTTERTGTNTVVAGLARVEEPRLDAYSGARAQSLGEFAAPSTNAPVPLASGATPPPSVPGEPAGGMLVSTNRPPEPFTREIHHLHFAYWDGNTWVDNWNSRQPPPAVEISFGFEPVPEGALAGEYPAELFRRVVALSLAGSPSGTPSVAQTP